MILRSLCLFRRGAAWDCLNFISIRSGSMVGDEYILTCGDSAFAAIREFRIAVGSSRCCELGSIRRSLSSVGERLKQTLLSGPSSACLRLMMRTGRGGGNVLTGCTSSDARLLHLSRHDAFAWMPRVVSEFSMDCSAGGWGLTGNCSR